MNTRLTTEITALDSEIISLSRRPLKHLHHLRAPVMPCATAESLARGFSVSLDYSLRCQPVTSTCTVSCPAVKRVSPAALLGRVGTSSTVPRRRW